MKKILSLLLMLSLLFFEACDNKIHFDKSPVVPAAEGWVKIGQDKNDNYRIILHVARLAQPERLTPSRKVYIVWASTQLNETKNLGMLKTESSLFSKVLKSDLETVVPFRPASVFITAEDSANVEAPGMLILNALATQK